MVTEQKIQGVALTRYRLGTFLIWLGVLAWLPFILLRMAGEKPSLLWVLPLHLLGVVGGSRLRSLARRELPGLASKKSAFRLVGHVLIYAGILVWVPYFYLKLVAGGSVEVMDFLPYHLTGIFGGILCLGLGYWVNRKNSPKE